MVKSDDASNLKIRIGDENQPLKVLSEGRNYSYDLVKAFFLWVSSIETPETTFSVAEEVPLRTVEATYAWLSVMQGEEGIEGETLDYKFHFIETVSEIQTRCMEYVCAFLNTHPKQKCRLVAGVLDEPNLTSTAVEGTPLRKKRRAVHIYCGGSMSGTRRRGKAESIFIASAKCVHSAHPGGNCCGGTGTGLLPRRLSLCALDSRP